MCHSLVTICKLFALYCLLLRQQIKDQMTKAHLPRNLDGDSYYDKDNKSDKGTIINTALTLMFFKIIRLKGIDK